MSISPRVFTGEQTRAAAKCPQNGEYLFLLHQRDWLKGTFIGLLAETKSLTHDNQTWVVSDMPRVRLPCYVIAGDQPCSHLDRCLRTQHGFSGSPWMTKNGDVWEVHDSHVARVMLKSHSNEMEGSIVIPLMLMRNQFQGLQEASTFISQ